MITMRMTADEMDANIRRDIDAMHPFIRRKWEEFRKIEKKNPPKAKYSAEIIHKVKQSNQEYLLIFVHHPLTEAFKSDIPVILLAIVKDDKRTYFVKLKNEYDKQIAIYSSHLFSRYAERLKQLYNYPKTIGKYCVSNMVEQCVYRNDIGKAAEEHCTKMVYAIKHGLLFCQVDPVKHHCIYRTFVSKDMLKENQLDAFKTVEPLLTDQGMEDYYDMITSGVDMEIAALARSQATAALSMCAHDLYEQYWDENE